MDMSILRVIGRLLHELGMGGGIIFGFFYTLCLTDILDLFLLIKVGVQIIWLCMIKD